MASPPIRWMTRRAGGSAGGFIFSFSLFLVFILIALSAALLVRSSADLNVAERFRRREQAFNLAEAGIDDALRVLGTSSIQWSDELRGADGLPGTADDGILLFDGIPSSDPPIPFSIGSYGVRVFDNQDEAAPTPDDPTTDLDGTIRIVSTGTLQDSQRQVEVVVWALFNFAIAANLDIIASEASFFGSIHANRNIVVDESGVLVGNAQATASGTFVFAPGTTLIGGSGDLVGGDPRIEFFRPDVAALQAAVDRKNPPSHTGTVALFDQEIAAYDLGLGVTMIEPSTVSLTGSATLVLFDGISVRFRGKVGPTALDPKTGKHDCTGQLNLNIIAVGGGSITFDETACLRGLIWAEGPVTLAERSTIAGAVVSAGSSVTVGEKSQVTHDPSAIDPALLPGFWGVAIRSWQEL